MTRLDRLRALALRGLTQTEAARIEGISRQYVHQLMRRGDISFSDDRRRISAARASAAVAMARAGMSIDEIVDLLGSSWSFVFRSLETAGVKVQKRAKTSKYEAAIRRLADDGLSQSEAARYLGVSPSCVCWVCKNMGIVMRDGRRTRA